MIRRCALSARRPRAFFALVGHSNISGFPTVHGFRRQVDYPNFTFIVIKLNISLLWFGVAAIITALVT